MNINLLELFSGIGGFTLGLMKSGFNINNHYFSEIDKHAIANYKYNFKNAKYVGPVQDVLRTRIERPDIITFGSPCQDFSLAGNQKGLEGERSVLILEAIKIIAATKPSVFIWENVKGAFSSNDGADFWAILNAFTNIGGYRLEWQLLNTSWVLPQNRERIYLVGHLAERSTGQVFPFTETDTRFAKRTADTPIVRAITAGGNSGGHHSGMTLVKQLNTSKNFGGSSTKQQDRVYSTSGLMACLSSHRLEDKIKITSLTGNEFTNSIRGGGRGSLTEKHNWDLVKAVLTPDRKEKRQNGRRFKENGEPAFTLNCQDQHGVQLDNLIRRLTEIECERLQGFPDDWTRYGNYDGIVKEIAKTHRYKMCGNAVTSDVVELIGERLIQSLK